MRRRPTCTVSAAPVTTLRGMTVTCFIGSLQPGGAERVFCQVAGWLAQQGAVVHVLTSISAGANELELPPGVTKAVLNDDDTRWFSAFGQLERLRMLRSALLAPRPDVVLSFLTETNILAILALRWSGVPVVVSERVDFREHRLTTRLEALRRITYPRASAVAVQTHALGDWVAVHRPRWKPVVIANPVSPAVTEDAPLPSWVPKGRLLLAVGRLVPQKGFDVLLEAFARVAGSHPDWSLVILGDGPDAGALRRKAEALDIADQVVLPGRVDPPWPLYQRADAYVMSSRYEGFPNSLAEAMAHGLPVVSTDCPTGPRELVRPDLDGTLVPVGDPGALADALDRLLSDEGLRQRQGENARDVVQRYAADRVLHAWGSTLVAAHHHRGHP